MTTITNAAIGAVISTHKGNRGIIESLEADRVIIRVPDGQLKSIPLTAIARWELPPKQVSEPAKAPVKVLAIGDRVKLKGTQLTYNIIELYEHFMGWVDGERTYESWAKLQTDDGKPAHWKVQQLEAIQ